LKGLEKKRSDFFPPPPQGYSTDVDSGNVPGFTFKDNSNVACISAFVGELPKSQMTQFDT